MGKQKRKHNAKTDVMPRLDAIEKMRAKGWETTFIGVIATEMGYVNQSKVCNAGMAIFKKVGSMTYREFRNVKVLLNGA